MNFTTGNGPVQDGHRHLKNYEVALKMLKCYKRDQFRIFSSAEEPRPVFACHFCHVPGYEHLLALANEEGILAIQDTRASKKSADNIISKQAHMNAIFELAWCPVSLRIVSVSGDQSATVWSVTGNGIFPLTFCNGHSRSVKVAAYRPHDADVFATGGRDGMIIIWDCRSPPSQHQAITIKRKPDNIIYSAHVRPSCGGGTGKQRALAYDQLSRAESITGLVFQDDHTLISCAAGDGMIKVWDARKFYSVSRRPPQPCHQLPYAGRAALSGFTSLALCPVSRLRLYANCVDSNVYCYNVGTYSTQPVAVYTGHRNLTYYVKSSVSADGAYLASGSSDEAAYVWSVARPHPIARLNGHAAEVTCVDWAANTDGDITVATCGDDSSHRLWRLHPPTDVADDTDQLAGWAEWLDATPAARAPPRRATKLTRTPSTDSVKRFKAAESPLPSSVESCLQSVENKEPRHLLDEATSLGVIQEMSSPTSNLPNYVVEGTSPHHRCKPAPSSASKQKENWLSKLQTTPSPSQKQPQRTTPRRRASQSKACGNLLRFFKVDVKKSSVECEGGLDQPPAPTPTAPITSR